MDEKTFNDLKSQALAQMTRATVNPLIITKAREARTSRQLASSIGDALKAGVTGRPRNELITIKELVEALS